MQQAARFAHDVFISHASQDVEWARKLAVDLRPLGFPDVFLDEQGLHAADPWEPTLTEAVRRSRHMVVLWSQHARESDWVSRERGLFDARGDPRADPLARSERMVALLLDLEMPSFASLQQIRRVKEVGAYAGGAENVDPQLWSDVVTAIAKGLNVNGTRVPVPVVVLAMNTESLNAVDMNAGPAVGKNLSAVLTSMSLQPAELAALYSDRRNDWRPLGSPDTIETIFLKMNADINQRLAQLGQQQFRWEFLGDAFWSSDFDTARREVARLISAPVSVVVVDPFSMYDQTVLYALNNKLGPALNNRQVLFMVLPPFSMPPRYRDFRELIKIRATTIFDQFYEPDLDVRTARAECSIHISDEQDLRRMLLNSVGRQLYRPQQMQVSPFLVSGVS